MEDYENSIGTGKGLITESEARQIARILKEHAAIIKTFNLHSETAIKKATAIEMLANKVISMF